jgi:ubiquinone/menaquinone biosynthesis C-methylase UbiE
MMKDEVKITVDTYDKIATEYCKHTLIDSIRAHEKHLVRIFLDYISSDEPLIADIGTGDGRDSEYMLELGVDILSIDLSWNMLWETKKNIPEGNLLQMDMRELGFPDDTLDGVWASGVIYHFPKSQLSAVLKEVRRVIKPGGVFSLNFKTGEGEGIEEDPRSYPGHPRYYAYYTQEEFQNYLDGFEVIETEQYPMVIYQDTIIHLWLRK